MIELSDKWLTYLVNQAETGMGYQVVSIILKDGHRYDQVVIIEGRIAEIRNLSTIPFQEKDIKEIILTHDKWDFNKERNF